MRIVTATVNAPIINSGFRLLPNLPQMGIKRLKTLYANAPNITVGINSPSKYTKIQIYPSNKNVELKCQKYVKQMSEICQNDVNMGKIYRKDVDTLSLFPR